MNLRIIPALNKVSSNITARRSPEGAMDIMPWHAWIFIPIQFILHGIFPGIWFRFPECCIT